MLGGLIPVRLVSQAEQPRDESLAMHEQAPGFRQAHGFAGIKSVVSSRGEVCLERATLAQQAPHARIG
jgi:hypothetical protein